jgi:ATP-binding cassette subfamily F protein 3
MINTQNIKELFYKYISQDQFEENVFDYIANMIIEDEPENESDLNALVGDYLADQLKYDEERINEICKELLEEMFKLGLKSARKAIIAEKLTKAVKLSDVKVGSENTITSLNFDPNIFVFEKQKDLIELQGVVDSSNTKNRSEALLKHLENVRKAKENLPELTMHHSRDESHKVDIIVPSFTISIGGKTLMEDSPLKISFGRRYVLVGRNGIGKTTLLNYVARKEIDGIPKHLQILHVEQEVVANDNLLIDEVLNCDYERKNLLNENHEIAEFFKNEENLKNKELSDKYTKRLVEVSKRLQDIDADSAEAKAIEIIRGLGFSQNDLKKPTKQFSGGWRMRISLAKALFVQPDILLLDEPTNHLDMNAVMWLEDYLNSWPYTLIVVSHARDFINNIATDIIYFTNLKLYYYKGNYDDFEKSRAEKNKVLSKQKKSQDKKLEHMQAFIDKFRANAKRASLVQSRIKAVNRIEIVEEILEDPTCIFVFPIPEKLNPPVLRLDNVDLGYDITKPLLTKINFNVDMTSRIAVVGPNGAGKTTLLKCLTNELNASSGMVYRHSKLKLAMFTQHHIDQLDLDLSPLEQLQAGYSDMGSDIIRAHLASFGITGNMALRPNYQLSGGQKTRVALALLVLKNPHIILMDEPTNHLDIDAVNALALALNSYNGGLCIVSHDQHFVESVCSLIYVVKDGKCTHFKGNFTDYKKHLRANGA